MTSKKKTFKLNTRDKTKQLSFVDLEYLGSGAYDCEIHVDSSGFMCKRAFGFDNDEYFLAKIRDVVANQAGEAELTDLQADSFIRFKPYTDDIREAPALGNILKLLEAGASIKAYDPEAMDHVRKLLGDRIELVNEEYEALDRADALMIMTEWPVFRTPEFSLMKTKMNDPVIFDGRNLYDPDTMKENGFNYISIGRKEVYVKE